MLLATQGFVLHTTPYAETSVVAHIFTRELGLKGYLIKGVRRPKSRSAKQSLLQPLTLLDLVVYDNHRSTLNYIKEMSLREVPAVADARTSALRFFVAEALYKSLREGEPLPALFDYVAIQPLAVASSSFPVLFLLRLSHFMGIEPLDNYAPSRPFFDVGEGCFVAAADSGQGDSDLSVALHSYLAFLHGEAAEPSFPLAVRQALIDFLLLYFRQHLGGFAQFNSHEILHAVLS